MLLRRTNHVMPVNCRFDRYFLLGIKILTLGVLISWLVIFLPANAIATDLNSWQCATPDEKTKVVRQRSLLDSKSTTREWGLQTSQQPWSTACDGNVIRFEVRNGDVWPGDARRAHISERVEITTPPLDPSQGDIWYAFSMMVEKGEETTSNWMELGQLHNTKDPGEISPSPAVTQGLAAGDMFRIMVRWASDNPLRYNPKPNLLYKEKLVREKYYNFVYRVSYSIEKGSLDVWMNGAHIISYIGPVGYDDVVGPYLKFGIYRPPVRESIVVNYANIEVGGAELKERITTPLKINGNMVR